MPAAAMRTARGSFFQSPFRAATAAAAKRSPSAIQNAKNSVPLPARCRLHYPELIWYLQLMMLQ